MTRDLEVRGAKCRGTWGYCTQGCIMSLPAQATEFPSTDDCVTGIVAIRAGRSSVQLPGPWQAVVAARDWLLGPVIGISAVVEASCRHARSGSASVLFQGCANPTLYPLPPACALQWRLVTGVGSVTCKCKSAL